MPEIAALGPRRGLLFAKPVVPDVRERLVERRLVVAAVVGQARHDVEPVVERRDQVAPANLDGVDLDRVGQHVDHPLEHEGRFRASRPAVRLDRRRIRVDTVDVFLHRRHHVRPRQHEAVQDRGNARRRGRDIRAHAGPHRATQAQDLPVLGRRQLHVLDVIAAVRGRLIVLRPRLDPLHRTSQLHRAERGHEVALDLRDLAAESAAHFRRDHPQTVFGHAGHERHDEAHDVRVLRRVPQRELAGCRRELRHRATRLHGGRDQPLLDDPVAHDDIGRAEGRVDVSAGDGPVERLVARRLGMELRRAGFRRGARIDHRWQRLVGRRRSDRSRHGPGRQTRRRRRRSRRRRSARRPLPAGSTERSSARRSAAARRTESAAGRCSHPRR